MTLDQPIRFSHLLAFGRSAMHGYYALTAAEDDPTYAMERGTAVHAILFGTKKVIGYPGAQRRGKDYDRFVLDHPDHEILTANEYAKAQRMADAIMGCKLAEPYLKGAVEQTIHFDWNALKCRSTPDVRGSNFVTELKTAPSADPNQFPWHACRMAYHAQMALERTAAGVSRAFIVCVEATEPHPVTVFEIDMPTLDIGDRMLTLWAERLKVSVASQSFPAYAQSVVPLSAPVDLLNYEEDE